MRSLSPVASRHRSKPAKAKEKGGGTGAHKKRKTSAFVLDDAHIKTLKPFFDDYRYCRGAVARDEVTNNASAKLRQDFDLELDDDGVADLAVVCLEFEHLYFFIDAFSDYSAVV